MKRRDELEEQCKRRQERRMGIIIEKQESYRTEYNQEFRCKGRDYQDGRRHKQAWTWEYKEDRVSTQLWEVKRYKDKEWVWWREINPVTMEACGVLQGYESFEWKSDISIQETRSLKLRQRIFFKGDMIKTKLNKGMNVEKWFGGLKGPQ